MHTNQKPKQLNEVVSFIGLCLESADHATLQERITFYRGLARICGDEEEAKQLDRFAKELQEHETRFRDFIHSFSQKTSS